MSTRTRTALWAAMVGTALACGGALAQDRQGKIVERYEPQEWTLTVTVNLHAYETRDPKTRMPIRDTWDYESAAVVFPLLKESAAHKLDERKLTSRLTLDDRPADNQVQMIAQEYHSGTRLGKWEMRDWEGEEVKLEVTLPVTTWRTRFDEAAAKKIGWPKDWPVAAKSTFEPMMFIDLGLDGQPYDMTPVKDLVKRYTNGKDPRTLPPVQLAKFLAGEVWKDFQPSGEGLEFDRTGLLEGIELQPVPETIKRRRGSEFDIVNVLLAVYREAGLPARLVVGYDVGGKIAGFLDRKSDNEEGLRAWVEFALWDETLGQRDPIWVPVDVLAMRKSSSRPRPLDQPWEYFGTHEELDAVIPIAFQYHPPTSVRAYGSPGFWGWMVLPEPPDQADQTLRFKVTSTPRRGGERDREPEDEDRPSRGRRNR